MGSTTFDSVMQGVVQSINAMMAGYQERVSEFYRGVEKAEKICDKVVEPFLVNLVDQLASMNIRARLEVQTDENGKRSSPRKFQLVIEQIADREFADLKSAPVYTFSCRGQSGGAVRVVSYIPNASRYELGKIEVDREDHAERLGELIEHGFGRLFKTLK